MRQRTRSRGADYLRKTRRGIPGCADAAPERPGGLRGDLFGARAAVDHLRHGLRRTRFEGF